MSNKATAPDAGRNIGYQDFLMHKYWHFAGDGFSTDETPVVPPDPVNVLTQIKVLTAGLSPASGLPDGVRWYDLVWLVHLVGMSTSRCTPRPVLAGIPGRGSGRDKEAAIPANGMTTNLHAYWDGLLGVYATPQIAIADALVNPATKLPDPDPNLASVADPAVWVAEGKKLSQDFVYAEPVRSGARPYMLDRQYETNARMIARQQAALAGARLANLINEALK